MQLKNPPLTKQVAEHMGRFESANQIYGPNKSLQKESENRLDLRDIDEQIKLNLVRLRSEKDYVKKLMISCILSSLYIEQYNYQEAYKLLTEL